MARRQQLVDASALEAVVADDQSDAGRWSVIEDFLLELHLPAYQQVELDPKRLGKAFAHLARVVVPRHDRPGVAGIGPER